MAYTKITSEHINLLQEILEADSISINQDQLEKYGRDETEDLMFKPEVVLKPKTVEQISLIMKFATTHTIPVTVRGAGTGLSGGALPVFGGIVLSMEYFNQILKIDERNLQATVEPGVINYVFQEEVKKVGLFYPPDPAS